MPGKGLRGRCLRWPRPSGNPGHVSRGTIRRAASPGPARAERRRLILHPLGSLRVRAAPLAAKRPLRHPRISPASALVRVRCCRRSSRASNCSGLTSCRTRARVLVALLEGPPLPGQISGYKNLTDDALSREPFDKS